MPLEQPEARGLRLIRGDPAQANKEARLSVVLTLDHVASCSSRTTGKNCVLIGYTAFNSKTPIVFPIYSQDDLEVLVDGLREAAATVFGPQIAQG